MFLYLIKIKKTMQKPFLYIYLLILVFTSCIKEEESPQELIFKDGYFIIKTGNQTTGQSASILFHRYDGDHLDEHSYGDLFSTINDEKIPGLLLDMAVNNDKACLLTRVQNDRLIITDKRTMRKEKEIILDSAESNAVFLTEQYIYVFSKNFVISKINIDSGQIVLTKNLSFLEGALNDVQFHDNKLYFSTIGKYGKLHVVDMKNKATLTTYNIGPFINSIVPLDDGVYITIEEPFNPYLKYKLELINPSISYGLVKVDLSDGSVNQIINSNFRYPHNLTYDNGLFLLIETQNKYLSSDTHSKLWNKTTGGLSEILKSVVPSYNSNFFLKLKDSRIYVLSPNYGLDVLDLDGQLIRGNSTGKNASKIVFLD